MAISVDWATGEITVLQSDMTALGGDVYELDLDWLRLQLRAAEASEEGMPFPPTHFHSTEVTISGTTFARQIGILSPYSVTISPAGAYQVSCTGANHNLQDVYNNLTGPTLLPNNSAGLIAGDCAEGTTHTHDVDTVELAVAVTSPRVVVGPQTIQLAMDPDSPDVAVDQPTHALALPGRTQINVRC